MRSYKENFNEEYQRGYKDGKKAIMIELDESESEFDTVKQQIAKLARKQRFSIKNNYKGLTRGGVGTLITGFYFDLMFNQEVYVIDIPSHEDATVATLANEVEFLKKAETLLKTVIKK